MRVWTVANQKGGVGKTTTTVALGGLAAEQGMRILLIDLDPHGSMTSYFRQDPDVTEHSVFNLFQERKSLSESLLTRLILLEAYRGIDLLPASVGLATLERQTIGDGMGLVISRALALIKHRYDLVLIDCPPQLGVLLVNALAACEQLIIPVQTEFLAIKGLERILNTIKMMSKSRRHTFNHLIVPTMFDRRTTASVKSLRTIRNQFGSHVWPGKIPVDTLLRDASKAGVPPHIHCPHTHSVDAYRSLYRILSTPPTAAVAGVKK